MNLLDLFSSKPLIEEGLQYAGDPVALEQWAALNVNRFGVPFFVALQAMILECNNAEQQNKNAWGSSFEDQLAYSVPSFGSGAQPSPYAIRRQALEALGQVALASCGPKIVEWAKSGIGKFISALGVTLPSDTAVSTPPPLPGQSNSPPPLQASAAKTATATARPAQKDEDGRHHVFLSHSRKDLAKSGVMKQIEYELSESAGLKPWIDHNGIPVSDPLFGTIEKAIEDCFAFALMWSENASKSESVQREIRIARDYGKPFIVCLLEEPKAHFPVPDDLRAIHFYPYPERAHLGMREFVGALLKLQTQNLASTSDTSELHSAIQHQQNLLGELDHLAARRAGGDRDNPVPYVKMSIKKTLDAMDAGDPDPEFEAHRRFFRLMLRQLDMDPDIQTNEDLFAVADYCRQRADPNGNHPELEIWARSLARTS
jgi:hypothetical protein